MALFAVDDDDLIEAYRAEKGKTYYCLECFYPVKVRRGSNHFFHFYHLKASPSCRLYSKSEDHLRAQVELQKAFPPNVLLVERPFLTINRVADLCWEERKIIFEVQCSLMNEQEAQQRIHDYKSVGYEVVWLLDDRTYNKKIVRPAERFLREHSCFFLSLKRGTLSAYYDQFEIFAVNQRVRKGNPRAIDFRQIRRTPSPEELAYLPRQVSRLFETCPYYFKGSRLDSALWSRHSPIVKETMRYWRNLEVRIEREFAKPTVLKTWITRYLVWPYKSLLKKLLTMQSTTRL
jgi:competence protein CoiA